jgi:hypothetical protein
MTAYVESTYWLDYRNEWTTFDKATDKYSLKEGAPERIAKSFELWKAKNPDHAT